MNKYTGTFEITLDGKEYTLRPTFEALVEFEERSGKAINEAFREMLDNKLSFKTIACALWAGILGEATYRNDQGYKENYIVVGEKIRKDGIQAHVDNASKFFSMALIPEDQQKKMVEEESEDTSKKNT